MKILKLSAVCGSIVLLSAASCPQQKQFECISFEKFAPNQIQKTPFDVDGWQLIAKPVPNSSGYPDSFRFYDPSGDNGPKNHLGPEVFGDFEFTPFPGRGVYSEVRVEYVSDMIAPPEISLLDKARKIIAHQKFAAEPQNSALEAKMSASGFAHVLIHGGELIVAKVCVR